MLNKTKMYEYNVDLNKEKYYLDYIKGSLL